ncbi:MAG: nitronate monooxygenase [Gemmatimonadetes bacterium]|nr:nitronate monooxygenase [Gemmatimonadota bacterium]
MTEAFGTTFSSPVLLAAGTCGFGEPLVEFMSPSEVGGLVTKSVTVEPRWGNPPPRVAEFADGMLNSVGLANPGLEAVRNEKLPWIRRTLGGLPVFVSVAGSAPDEYAAIVSGLDGEDGFLGFELNLSCPNDSHLRGSASGLPFGLDPEALAHLVELVRPLTERPLIVKLAPNDPEIARSASRAVDCGADGVTAVNTMPGTLPPGGDGPRLGAGSGGMSGPALLPTALGAVARVAAAVDVPVLGVGGILSARDARAFLDAGATMIQIGTASFADPRSAAVVARGLAELA